jgi:monoterpene epsilon-lactone hydrolase
VSEFTLDQLVTLLRERATPPGSSVELQRRDHDLAVSKAPVATGVEILRSMSDGGPIEWLIPLGRAGSGVLLWFHGGGFGMGSCGSARGMVSHLAAMTGARGVTLDYRLAPEHPFPSAVEDAFAAYRWLIEKQGVDPKKLVVGGDSSGGGLALAMLASVRDANYAPPAGVLCFSPWVDLSLSARSLTSNAATDPQVTRAGLEGMASRYLRDVDPESPLASPLFGELKGLPPLLIQVGEAEALLDDSVRLARAATEAGCDVTLDSWPKMIHVWQAFAPGLAEGTAALVRAAHWLAQRWGESGAVLPEVRIAPPCS